MDEGKITFGFCWYHPEQWDRLLEISDDREQLEDSYEEWRKNVHKAIQEMNAAETTAQKVNIDLEELLGWCNEKGIPVDSKARSEFVTIIMRRRNEKP